MRRQIIPILLALLIVAVACKRTDPQPAKKQPAPKAEGTEKPAPKAELDKSTVAQQPAQVAQPNEAEPPEAASARQPPPSVPVSELLGDDPACVAKLDREAQDFRRDKLPRLIEEEQAVEVFTAWLGSTAKILEAGEAQRLLGLLDEGREELRNCRKDIEPRFHKLLTMMSLPAEAGSIRMPHFYCEGNLSHEVEWCSSYVLRLGQWDLLDALWTEGNSAARFCRANSVGKAAGEALVKRSLVKLAECQALLQSDDCSADGLTATTTATRAAYTNYCLAVQAGLKNESCGGAIPSGSSGCELVDIIKKGKGAADCQELSTRSETIVPDIFCQKPKAFAEVDCKTLLETQLPPAFRDLEMNSCKMAKLARTHAKDCGDLSEAGPHCYLYKAYRASLSNHGQDSRIESRGKFVFMSRAWAQTILQEPGVRLATLVAQPGQLGEPRISDEPDLPPPGELAPGPPPDGGGPSRRSPVLLPDFWAEARGEHGPNGPPPGGEKHQPPGGGHAGMPPPGGHEGMPPSGGHAGMQPPGGHAGMQPPGGHAGMGPQGSPPEGSGNPVGEPPPGGPPEGEEPPPGAPPLDQFPPGDKAAFPRPRDGKLAKVSEEDLPPLPKGEVPFERPPEHLASKMPPGPPIKGKNEIPAGWASLYGMTPPKYDSNHQAGHIGKPGERPPPDGSRPSTLLVSGAFVDPLTTTGGPIQRAMAEFALDTVQIPGKFRHKKESPCEPYLIEKKMFPSSDGRLMTQVRGLNVSKKPLRCEFHLTVEGAEGKSDKTRKITLLPGEVGAISASFEHQMDAQLIVHQACAPVAEDLQKEKKAATEDAPLEPTLPDEPKGDAKATAPKNDTKAAPKEDVAK